MKANGRLRESVSPAALAGLERLDTCPAQDNYGFANA
jgi:hypothetical protein